jgi:hypothetical protein
MKLCLDSLSRETGIDFEKDGWSIDDPYINGGIDESNPDDTTILTPIKEWFHKKHPTIINRKKDDEILKFAPEPKYTYDQDIKAKRDF